MTCLHQYDHGLATDLALYYTQGPSDDISVPNRWVYEALVFSTPSNTQDILESQVDIYPNPTSDYLNVAIKDNHPGQEYSVSIVSVEGQVLKSFVTSVPLFTMDMSDLNAGVYTLQIQGQKENTIQKRFIKIQ